LSNSFPIQNGLKQGDALSALPFNFASEYTIRKVQETQVGLKLNGTHQLLTYADNVNLLGGNIDTVKKSTETLIEFDLEINVEKAKYMLLSRHHNLCQNWVIKISFENELQFKYLRTTVANQNLFHEEIKRTSNSDNACYHSVQNLLSFFLSSKT
jgi:hypothetical protein